MKNVDRLLLFSTLLICVFIITSPLFGQSSLESEVLQKVQRKYSEGGVNFSDLYNSPDFTSKEKAFLGRLYEIFFSIPGFLKTEYEATGNIPSRSTISKSFGVSPHSIELLLRVMESDRRVPSLFERDRETGQIVSLKIDNITAFMDSRGSQVRMTQWTGQALPRFSLQTLDGESLSSSDLKDKNTLLYFWFTGCPPCVRIAPILSQLHQEYTEVQFVGINADEVLGLGTSNSSRIDYLQKQGIEFLNANLDEITQEAFGNINVYPTIFLVDEKGVIVEHLLNFQSEAKLSEALDQLLK